MKYELEKHLFTHPVIIENIDLTLTEIEKVFIDEITFEDEYNRKIDSIKLSILKYIEEKDALTGKEAVTLIKNMEWIIKRLTEQKEYAELLYNNGESFVEMLESLLRVSREHIANYEKAMEQLTGKRLVYVIIDGNNNSLPKPIQTEIIDNVITIEKCREVTEKINALGHEPKEIQFNLHVYTESKGNEFGDWAEECLLNREVKYYPSEDCMQVWENEKLIKEV